MRVMLRVRVRVRVRHRSKYFVGLCVHVKQRRFVPAPPDRPHHVGHPRAAPPPLSSPALPLPTGSSAGEEHA